MAIDIANPGADAPELKAAIAALMGMELLAAGDFSNDLKLDLALPAGYSLFRVILSFQVAPRTALTYSGYLSAAFSFDGGATFAMDLDNYDSYISTLSAVVGDALATDQDYEDAAAMLSQQQIYTFSFVSLEATIYPGAVGKNPTIYGRMGYAINDSSISVGEFHSMCVEQTGLADLIRIATNQFLTTDPEPEAIGDAGGFASGTYRLFGVPAA